MNAHWGKSDWYTAQILNIWWKQTSQNVFRGQFLLSFVFINENWMFS